MGETDAMVTNTVLYSPHVRDGLAEELLAQESNRLAAQTAKLIEERLAKAIDLTAGSSRV